LVKACKPPPASLPDSLTWPFVEINGAWAKEVKKG
jgi:hypothetical protein